MHDEHVHGVNTVARNRMYFLRSDSERAVRKAWTYIGIAATVVALYTGYTYLEWDGEWIIDRDTDTALLLAGAVAYLTYSAMSLRKRARRVVRNAANKIRRERRENLRN